MPLYDPAMYHFATPAPCCWQEMCAPLEVPVAPVAEDLDCDVAFIGGGL